jgi:hypothetical protein
MKKPPAKRRLASSFQLYPLNRLGRLADAMNSDDGRVYADHAWEVLNLAAANGEWTPKKRLGESAHEHQRRMAEEAERERERDQYERAVRAWRKG